MRGLWSTRAAKLAIGGLVILIAFVYWNGMRWEQNIRAEQDPAALEAPVAQVLIDEAWRRQAAMGVAVVLVVAALGILAARAELRSRQASSSLDETEGELHELSLARTSFLAMMSHELRTPLNSIIGFSGILSSGMAGDLTVEQRKQVGIINSAGKQLLALINDILDLSKLETGKLVLVAEEFEIASVAEAVTDTLRPLAEDRGLELRVRISDAEMRMCTDRRRLEQVLLNIVARAIRMTEAGHVLTEIHHSAGTDIVFKVSDTSSGMTPQEVAGLFEEHKEIVPRPGRARSTGFALMVSRRLARALGGDISVESEPGLGSVFTLTVPEVIDERMCA